MSGDYRYCACGDPSIDHRPGCAFCDCREFRERMTDPTPATPDEAVDILATVIGMRTGTRYDGVPDRSRDLATMFLADLAADGWTLSRQQGDTVAARVEDVARRMHARSQDPASWDAVPDHDWWLREAALLLGIGADGAGDGR